LFSNPTAGLDRPITIGWGTSAVCHVGVLVASLFLGALGAFERAKSPGADSVVSLQLELVTPEAEYEPSELPIVLPSRDEVERLQAPDVVVSQLARDNESFQSVTPPELPATEMAVVVDINSVALPKLARPTEPVTPKPNRPPTQPQRPIQSRRPSPESRKIEAVAIGAGAVTPARLLENRPPVYPEEAVRRGIEGKLVLRLTISASGTVSRVEVAESSGYRMLDDAAVAAVREWKFIPAQRGGQPVSWTARQPIRFRRN
jgi:TonB family protein